MYQGNEVLLIVIIGHAMPRDFLLVRAPYITCMLNVCQHCKCWSKQSSTPAGGKLDNMLAGSHCEFHLACDDQHY